LDAAVLLPAQWVSNIKDRFRAFPGPPRQNTYNITNANENQNSNKRNNTMPTI
jgi:hypothetical protein